MEEGEIPSNMEGDTRELQYGTGNEGTTPS